MPANNPRGHPETVRLGHRHRDRIQVSMIINRLTNFVNHDPLTAWPAGVNMTRTQVHTALALLRKVLPDLASVEVSGNPEKPLMVQVVRFSDGEELLEPRPVIDMGKLLEVEKTEIAAIEAEVRPDAKSNKSRTNGRNRTHADGTKDGSASKRVAKP